MSNNMEVLVGCFSGTIIALILVAVILIAIKRNSKIIEEVNINGVTIIKIHEPKSNEDFYYHLGDKVEMKGIK